MYAQGAGAIAEVFEKILEHLDRVYTYLPATLTIPAVNVSPLSVCQNRHICLFVTAPLHPIPLYSCVTFVLPYRACPTLSPCEHAWFRIKISFVIHCEFTLMFRQASLYA